MVSAQLVGAVAEALTQPFPQQQADPALLSEVLTALEDSMSELREVGHNVIVGALALRAFQISPQLLTPSRATGALHSFNSSHRPPQSSSSGRPSKSSLF